MTLTIEQIESHVLCELNYKCFRCKTIGRSTFNVLSNLVFFGCAFVLCADFVRLCSVRLVSVIPKSIDFYLNGNEVCIFVVCHLSKWTKWMWTNCKQSTSMALCIQNKHLLNFIGMMLVAFVWTVECIFNIHLE